MMRIKSLCILLIACGVFASGCDLLHFRRYEVSGVVAGSPDAAKLKIILQTVAEKSGLKETQAVSNKPCCLISYEGGNSVTLGANFHQDSVLILLIGGFGTPSEYKQAKRLLPRALSAEFGGRFSILK